MLTVASFATIVTSLNSTKLASAERKLAWGKVFRVRTLAVWLGKGANLILLFFLIRYLPRSQLLLWTLIIGGAVTAVPLCVLSHILLEGKFNRFQWDRTAFQSLYRYGVWILGICVLESLMYNFELLASGNFLSLNSFAVYDYLFKAAPFFMGFSLVPALRQWVLFPVYSELVRTHSSVLYLFLKKCRLIILCAVSILALLSIPLGKPIISMLFDNRFVPFLGLFHFLSIQAIVSTVSSTYDDVLYAQGKTSTLFFLTAIQVVLETALFFLGMRSFGVQGILLGIIISSYLIYAVKAFYFARQSLWQPIIDFPFLVIASILLIAFLSQNKGLAMM
jgi:O-antigen/teichoic acid export membrane protein